MVARLLALVIALSTGVTGILPAGDGYRCVFTKQRMEPSADCCAKCDAPVSSISQQCCEYVRGATPEARAPHSVDEPRLPPAPLLAVLTAPSILFADLGSTARNLRSFPRGRPPGEQLHQLSEVLRI
jgi:hypothetical protein